MRIFYAKRSIHIIMKNLLFSILAVALLAMTACTSPKEGEANNSDKAAATAVVEVKKPIKKEYPKTIQWVKMDEAIKQIEAGSKKKVFVDVYTNWCGWCKKMDQATFQQAKIAQYMNEHFISVKFNAEQREDVVFKDKTYKYVASGRRGYHELAAAIMNGKMSYPTVVFLDEKMNMIQPVPGFQAPDKFQVIATYFGGDHFKKTAWDVYQQNYQPL